MLRLLASLLCWFQCRRRHYRTVTLVSALLLSLGLLLLSLYWASAPSAQHPGVDLVSVAEEDSLKALGPEPRPALPNEVAIVVLAAKRPEVQVLLRQLLALRPPGFRIFVSQDGFESSTTEVLSHIGTEVTRLRFSTNIRRSDSYARISRHHLHVLDHVFLELGFRHAILMEDDLLIAPDFYTYFGSLRAVLDEDPSVFCVSAWNDNGLAGRVADEPTLLYRTDFFPGLGWMLSRSGWAAVRAHWPETQFDDFLRQFMLKNRLVCVRPEISRTFNTGRCGGRDIGALDTYGRQFYHEYLSRIVLNQNNVSLPTSAVRSVIGKRVDEEFRQKVLRIPEITIDHFLALSTSQAAPTAVRLRYQTALEYVALAEQLDIIPEVWFGAPRASILGIVTVSYGSSRVYIAPDSRLPFSDAVVSAADEQWRRVLLSVWGAALLVAGCLLAAVNRLFR